MSNSYSIIPPFSRYPIFYQCEIIAGTPFLYLSKYKILVLGDIHLGIESSMFGYDNNKVSNTCIRLTELVLKAVEILDVNTVVCNGDIKHHTAKIRIQELEELKYFTSKITNRQVKLIFIEGNHDELLEFTFPFLDLDYISLIPKLILDGITIQHGHQETAPQQGPLLIMSHEHPAFTMSGLNRTRIKLPAFVTLQAGYFQVIIIPAANNISLGTNFPPKDNKGFISPFLKREAQIETIEIFPFDLQYGLFELPVSNGNKSWTH